jgi:hypothetical protein
VAQAWDPAAIATPHQLTISRGTNASGWATVLTEAVKHFNNLAGLLNSGVTYVETKTTPDPTTVSSTNVSFQTADGKISVNLQSNTATSQLPGKTKKGMTLMIGGSNGWGRAGIFVPRTATFSHFMKVCITVHELVHAAGLDNGDHSPETDADIFSEFLVEAGSKVECGLFAGQTMPPIWMTRRTAQKIAALWP